MTDFTFGVARPNWKSATGVASMSSAFEFITIATAVDILTYAQNVLAGSSLDVATASQQNLNKLLEIVSLRGQPVVMGNVVLNAGVYTIMLATEHYNGWGSIESNSADNLKARLIADGINFGFGANLSAVTSATTATVTNATVIPVASTTGILTGDTFTGTGVVGGVVAEILSATSFSATVAQTIASATTLTFVPADGAGVNDTTTLAVTFSNVLT